MKKLPAGLMESLSGVEGFNRESFIAVHEGGDQVTSVRMNSARETHGIPSVMADENDTVRDTRLPFDVPVPWCSSGFYLQHRPSFTFDPLFHAGCYYVQDASSMFLEQPFRQLLDLSQPLKVLDLCAAPGGKSTHIQSLISNDSLLVSNEVIRSRMNILKDNVIRWGAGNVIVTLNDPSAFQSTEGYFDVMVVDAPCSGSGLFRKDNYAIDEWSFNNVQLCSQRQQRILADALPALKQGGLLIYSTCSYSVDEDEKISAWLSREMEMENVTLTLQDNWNIIPVTDSQGGTGYRFFPDRVRGEGFFMACFRKNGTLREPRLRPVKLEKSNTSENQAIRNFIKATDHELIRDQQNFYALPPFLSKEYALLRSVLNIQYGGTGLGAVMKGRLVPDHALAMSNLAATQLPAYDVTYEQAIRYLQRQDMDITTTGTGWQLIRYQTHNLGWVNVLPNRLNNYYPKELRILKQSGHASF